MEVLKKIFAAICAFFKRLGRALCKGMIAFWEALTEKAETENNK